jgi:hypothetical protein
VLGEIKTVTIFSIGKIWNTEQNMACTGNTNTPTARPIRKNMEYG